MKWQRIWRNNQWNISNWGRGSLVGAKLGKFSVKFRADWGYLAFQMRFPLFVAQLWNNQGWESPGRFGPFEVCIPPNPRQPWLDPAPASSPLETLGGIFKGIRGCWTLVSLRLFKNESLDFSFCADFPWCYSLGGESTLGVKIGMNGHRRDAGGSFWGIFGGLSAKFSMSVLWFPAVSQRDKSSPCLSLDLVEEVALKLWRRVPNLYLGISRPAPLGFSW